MKSKIIFFLIIITTLSSCKATKNNIVINSYFDNITKGSVDKIIILKQKIDNRRTLAIFKGTYTYNPKTKSYEKDGEKSKLYNLDAWNKMSSRYTYDTIKKYWKKRDFNYKNIIVEENKDFLDNKIYSKYLNDNYKVYSFSDPITYENENYMLFTVLFSDSSFSRTISEYVIIMKKKDKKWIVVDKVYQDDYIN